LYDDPIDQVERLAAFLQGLPDDGSVRVIFRSRDQPTLVHELFDRMKY
jgi:hypothetical protein